MVLKITLQLKAHLPVFMPGQIKRHCCGDTPFREIILPTTQNMYTLDQMTLQRTQETANKQNVHNTYSQLFRPNDHHNYKRTNTLNFHHTQIYTSDHSKSMHIITTLAQTILNFNHVLMTGWTDCSLYPLHHSSVCQGCCFRQKSLEVSDLPVLLHPHRTSDVVAMQTFPAAVCVLLGQLKFPFSKKMNGSHKPVTALWVITCTKTYYIIKDICYYI